MSMFSFPRPHGSGNISDAVNVLPFLDILKELAPVLTVAGIIGAAIMLNNLIALRRGKKEETEE